MELFIFRVIYIVICICYSLRGRGELFGKVVRDRKSKEIDGRVV
jgi:hypothetical protein